jgi:iron complex outermembrane receptor protein
VYLSKYKDVVITSQRLDNAGIPFTGPQNVGSADIKGFELELEAHPTQNFAVSAAVGMTDFKWKKLGTAEGCQDLGASAVPNVNCIPGNPGYGDIAPGSSKWKGNVGAQYAFVFASGASVTPRVDLSYASERFNNNWNKYAGANGTGPIAVTPAVSLLSARLTWEDESHTWSVAAFGTNLTNKYYYQSFLDLRSFREWAVSINKKF